MPKSPRSVETEPRVTSPTHLFLNDPFYKPLLKLYEASLWRYVSTILFFMCALPVAALHLSSELSILDCGEGQQGSLAGFLVLYGLAPLAGSFLGYRWLVGFLELPHKLLGSGAIAESTGRDLLSAIKASANQRRWSLLTLVFIVLLAPFGDRLCRVRLTSPWAMMWHVYVQSLGAIWWYLMIKAGLVCVSVLLAWKNSLTEAKINVDLFHSDQNYGLAPIGHFSFSFLLFYFAVIGSYLSIVVFEQRLSYAFRGIVAGCYAFIAFLWIVCMFTEPRRAILREKSKALGQVDLGRRDLENRRRRDQVGFMDYAQNLGTLADFAERINALSVWPLGRVRQVALSLAVISPWMTAAAGFLGDVKAFSKTMFP